MANEFTKVMTTLWDCMGDQTEHLHSLASQTVSIPTVWRTASQRLMFGQRWSGLQEPQRVREAGFLEALRRELKATGLFRLALTAEARYPHLLAAAPEVDIAREERPHARRTISQVRKWPSSELRKVAGFASQMGNHTPLDCALIRFPSRTFPRLSHAGIETVVLAFFPERRGRHSSAYRQVFVIVNGGISELGGRRSLKNQHENLACHLIYNLRKHAEDAWVQAVSVLKQVQTADNPSLVLHFLQQQAEAAKDCGYKLPGQWSSRLLDAALHEFSSTVRCFLSPLGYGRSQAAFASARQWLIELGVWLRRATWLDMLLVNNRALARRAGMVLINAIADICALEPTTEPITLQAVARRLGRRLGTGPYSVSGLKAAEVRGLLKTHLKHWYSEQDCTATVLETYRSRTRIEVRGENEGEMFRTSVPLGSLPGRPEEGDRYKLVVWDLWRHWFGIAAAKKIGSVIPDWTPDKRHKFEKELRDIQFGTVVERGGKS